MRADASDGVTSENKKRTRDCASANKQLEIERDILSKAAAWFASETDSIPSKSSNS